jgi:hypothetical protein
LNKPKWLKSATALTFLSIPTKKRRMEKPFLLLLSSRRVRYSSFKFKGLIIRQQMDEMKKLMGQTPQQLKSPAPQKTVLIIVLTIV